MPKKTAFIVLTNLISYLKFNKSASKHVISLKIDWTVRNVIKYMPKPPLVCENTYSNASYYIRVGISSWFYIM